jgi:hypothetical protein
MRSKLIFSRDRIHEVNFFPTFHEIEIPNNAFKNFDLMIVFVTNKSIMRSKFKIKHY